MRSPQKLLFGQHLRFKITFKQVLSRKNEILHICPGDYTHLVSPIIYPSTENIINSEFAYKFPLDCRVVCSLDFRVVCTLDCRVVCTLDCRVVCSLCRVVCTLYCRVVCTLNCRVVCSLCRVVCILDCWYVHSTVEWYVHSTIEWYVHSTVEWYVHSTVEWYVHTTVEWYVHSTVEWYVHSTVEWYVHSTVEWYVHSTGEWYEHSTVECRAVLCSSARRALIMYDQLWTTDQSICFDESHSPNCGCVPPLTYTTHYTGPHVTKKT